MNNPQITVVIGDLLGCGYYRCVLPYRSLSERGFNVTITNIMTFESLKTADAVVFQRQHNPQVADLIEALKANGTKTAYEIDDLLHDIPLKNPCRAGYMPNSPTLAGMEKVMRSVDLLTVSTEPLKSFYEDFVPNAHVCPNALDKAVASEYPFSPATYVPGEEFRMGWAGSGTHQEDLELVLGVILEIMKEYKQIKFYFIGQDYRQLVPLSLRARFHHVGHTFPISKSGKILLADPENNPVLKYYELLKSADLHLALAPIIAHRFNRSKSYIKLIEYGLASIPAVASAYGPYQRYAKQYSWHNRASQPVLLADSKSDWRRCLREMITDNALRLKIAENNYKNVNQNHVTSATIENHIQALASIGIVAGSQPGTYEEKIYTPT